MSSKVGPSPSKVLKEVSAAPAAVREKVDEALNKVPTRQRESLWQRLKKATKKRERHRFDDPPPDRRPNWWNNFTFRVWKGVQKAKWRVREATGPRLTQTEWTERIRGGSTQTRKARRNSRKSTRRNRKASH